MLWYSLEALLVNTHNMFSWRNKKYINILGQKKKEHLFRSYVVGTHKKCPRDVLLISTLQPPYN